MEHHPIDELMATTLENLREMVDVNTVVGDPIAASNGATVIPVSKVSFGFVAGGGEYDVGKTPPPDASPFAGGSGAGVSVQPVGFLVITGDSVRLLPAQSVSAWERAAGCVPQLIDDVLELCRKGGKLPEKAAPTE